MSACSGPAPSGSTALIASIASIASDEDITSAAAPCTRAV